LLTNIYLFIQLHRELTLVLGVPKSTEFLKDWASWRSKILDYARREAPTRPAINSLLQQYLSEDVEQLSSDGEYTMEIST
jgi:hypothetical protein